MRIMISSSMYFAKEILANKKKLESLGHDVSIPVDTEWHLEPNVNTDNHEEDYNHCVENDVIRRCLDLIRQSDALFVNNYPKQTWYGEGIYGLLDGYIGPSVFAEMFFAHYFRKAIYLLFPPPPISAMRSSHEVMIMQPRILNGDLTKIGK